MLFLHQYLISYNLSVTQFGKVASTTTNRFACPPYICSHRSLPQFKYLFYPFYRNCFTLWDFLSYLFWQMLGDNRRSVVDHQNTYFSHHTRKSRRLFVSNISHAALHNAITLTQLFTLSAGELFPLHPYNPDFTTEDELPWHRKNGIQSVLVGFLCRTSTSLS